VSVDVRGALALSDVTKSLLLKLRQFINDFAQKIRAEQFELAGRRVFGRSGLFPYF
jgi:hypothetical protein